MYTLNSVEVHAVAYGVVTKGNGDAFINKTHTSLSAGGGQAGQGYPCVLIAYGLDTYNQMAEEELMPTIRTNGGGDCIPKVAYSIDKAITTDRPHAVAYGFDNYNLCLTCEVGKTLQAEGGWPGVNEGCVVIENHPNDSRVKLSKDNIVQSLTSRMGTGGGNVPLVMEKK